MGACACAVNNSGKKEKQNQIIAADQNQIEDQIEVIAEQQLSNKRNSRKILSMKKVVSIKQRSHPQFNDDQQYVNWSSLVSNKDGSKYMLQQSLSQYSNTLASNSSNIVYLEEKQRNGALQDELQNQNQPKIVQKQTAKNRNWSFNRRSLINQGLREEDNALIQHTHNIEGLMKLQAIKLKVGVTYYGEWFQGMRHGHGIQIWEDDSRYEGQFQDNQHNGHGTLNYSDGDVYVGDWKDDCFHGQGKYTCYNGYFYEGQWFLGKKDGKGTQAWQDSQVYFGEFKNGQKHGRGLMKFKDGSFYEGEFACNQINGRGKYVWINSRQYDGDWIKNKMSGFGILKWTDGWYFKGQFFDDKRHGQGQMYYIDGTRYNGNWKFGKQDGHGQTYEGTKLKYSGQWKDGKKVKKNNKYLSGSTFSR